jgi:hypothetical protein
MNMTGRQDWLERYTGQGSTYFMMKMFFLLILVLGILYATGLGVPLLTWIFSPLRDLFSGGSST